MYYLPSAAAVAWVAGMFLVALLTGCGDQAGPDPGSGPMPRPMVPVKIVVASGDGQAAQVGTELLEPIAVTVLDAEGSPVAGAGVEWEGEDDDRLVPLAGATDAKGVARARWRLGTMEGRRMARARLPGLPAAVFTAVARAAEDPEGLPVGEIVPLAFTTYDGSGQVVHPDYAVTPAGAFGQPLHLAITPYPFGNAAFENPSFFEGGSPDHWALPTGAPNPVVLPDVGYLSDPDLVYVPETGELRLYYRQVTTSNIVQLVRTQDGILWSAPVEVARAANHRLISPSVVRRGADDWWMFAVNAGSIGCAATSTTVEVRRSTDGLTWGQPATAALVQPGLWPWHIDVQWIAERNEFWAVYNVKTEGSCTTPAVYIASSADGVSWDVAPGAVMVKGTARELQDIVYRTTFAYDPGADAVTFWYSGARFADGQYHWGAAVQRRQRQELFSLSRAAVDPRSLPPAPAPLEEWP